MDVERGECQCVQPDCGHRWCCNCQVNLESSQHAGISCQQYQEWKKQNDTSDEAMEQFLRDQLADPNGGDRMRRCPHCQTPWMKDEACAHVTCERFGGGCGKHFCFQCAQFSADDGDAIYNHQRDCPGFQG